MKIQNLQSESKGDWSRVSATVTWEDCDRPTRTIYFETTGEAAQDLICNPDAFLVAAIVPAMDHQEKRLFIDAEICPQLWDGVEVALQWMRQWYKIDHTIVIEAKPRSQPLISQPRDRAGFMFSGGIDSLSLLRANHLRFPPTHPGFIREGILIHGFNFGRYEGAEQLDAFKTLESRLLDLSQQIGIKLISVRTNLRHLDNEHPIWGYKLQGAALSAVAHTLIRRLTSVSIGSTHSIQTMQPKGSHPLLDPNYSSFNLKVQHGGIEYSRLAKTRLVADWDLALQQLRVCDKVNALGRSDLQNCCQCDKCIRTMAGLMVLDKLEQASTFAVKDVTTELLFSIRNQVNTAYQANCYEELIAPLAAQGRNDLARGLKQIVAGYKRKAEIKQFDQRYLNGGLVKLVKAIRGGSEQQVGYSQQNAVRI